MVGLLVAAVIIVVGVLGVGIFLGQPSPESSEEIMPGEIPTERPVLNNPVQANETIDQVESLINSTVQEQQQRVNEIEQELLGQ